MENYIFDFVFGEGLRDTVGQRAYIAPKKGFLKNCSEVKKYIKEFIDEKILKSGFASQADYDKQFDELLLIIERKFNVLEQENGFDKQFSFGHAQKLANMVIKYFYIITYKSKGDRDCFKYCHCPMDGIMKEIAMKNLKKLAIEDKEAKKILDKSKGKIDKCYNVGWSKVERSHKKVGLDQWPWQYVYFQRIIRYLAGKKCFKSSITSLPETIAPLEYDYITWKMEL